MRVRIILGTYNPTEYFAIYEMRLECFRCFVIPILVIRNMLLTFLLMYWQYHRRDFDRIYAVQNLRFSFNFYFHQPCS